MKKNQNLIFFGRINTKSKKKHDPFLTKISCKQNNRRINDEQYLKKMIMTQKLKCNDKNKNPIFLENQHKK
jgi:hypothetical protein